LRRILKDNGVETELPRGRDVARRIVREEAVSRRGAGHAACRVEDRRLRLRGTYLKRKHSPREMTQHWKLAIEPSYVHVARVRQQNQPDAQSRQFVDHRLYRFITPEYVRGSAFQLSAVDGGLEQTLHFDDQIICGDSARFVALEQTRIHQQTAHVRGTSIDDDANLPAHRFVAEVNEHVTQVKDESADHRLLP